MQGNGKSAVSPHRRKTVTNLLLSNGSTSLPVGHVQLPQIRNGDGGSKAHRDRLKWLVAGRVWKDREKGEHFLSKT